MILSTNHKPILLGAFCVLAANLLLAATPVSAAEATPKKINFADDVRPMFQNACLNCHNPDKKKAELDLSSYQGIMAGSSNGAVLKPGDAGASVLYKVCTHAEEPAMPKNGARLPEKDLAVLKQWIDGGAPESAASKVTVAAKRNDISVVTAGAAKPDGPPPMPPVTLSLEPVCKPRRPGAITAMAANPWSPVVAIAGQHQVLLYHTQTLDLLGILPFPEGQPQVLRFSRSGRVLLIGGGQAAKSGKVVLWDVTTGQRLADVGDEFDAVLAADLSPDQSLVAIGGSNKVLRTYSTRDNKPAYAIKKHTDWVTAVAFSPDGVMLASGDRAGNLFVWEAKPGHEFYTLAGHKEGIAAVAFRDDSNVLASASTDGTVKLWNMHEGTQITSFNAHGSGVTDVAFAHDGKLVTCGRDNLVKLWNPDGSPIRSFDPFADIALHVAISDDGSRVIGGDWTGAIRVWNAADAKRVGELEINPGSPTERLAAAQKALDDAASAASTAESAVKTAQSAPDKTAADLAEAQRAKGADQVQAAHGAVANATNEIQSASQRLQRAREAVGAKQNELNQLQMRKTQLAIELENAPPKQRQQVAQQIQKNEADATAATKRLKELQDAIAPAEDAANKAAAKVKEAQSALAKAIDAADPLAKQWPAKSEAARQAAAALQSARSTRDAAQQKLAAAKSDADHLKASVARSAPTTKPAGRT